jgi:hypothetical protein
MSRVSSEAEAVKRLMSACPGFDGSFVRYRESGGDVEESYNVVGELAQWVVTQTSNGDFACFKELFAELESLFENPSPDVRQVLVTGFIEDIHNLAVFLEEPHRRVDPDLVLQYLGPASRAAWFELVKRYQQRGESWPGRVRDDS